MRYDFTRLSPEQFEEMVVSLYAKKLGFETKIYGAGPDGQREFTFDRPFRDDQGNEFTGRTFGQVKYRSSSTKGDEFTWLKDQFEGEMERFEEKEASYRPQNYFFITNLVLTPVKETGIKDKLDKLAESYRKLIPNIFILGYDEICKLLDNNADVRKAYTGLIMPGDVLAELLEKFRKDFSGEINVFLRSAFLEDRYTRIDQAGSIPENLKTLIADVGIDLVVKEQNGTEGKALERFIETGNQCLNPNEGRFIVIGGPGKGKSTITQFLAQIYRTSYLAFAGAADEETEAFLTKTKKRFDFEVRNYRIPFVLEIKRYADWIANRGDESKSLLAYMACSFNRICDSGLTPNEVGELFKKMPWLLVLDGLDEVPESSNRNAVVDEIDRFIATRLRGADCMIIATSREMGYGGDFDNKKFRRLELKDLTPEDCLKYLTYFFDVTEERQDNRERYLNIIKKALDDNEKAALLSTPLQASIMAIIVKSGGNLPNNRYDLFREYCDVVIKREAQKEILPVLNGDISNGWIYELHQRIALHLMEASDSPENPAAELPLEGLKKEIRAYLNDYLDPMEENPENADIICLRAVTERVCFLTEAREDVFSFSIRSMQEFFAGIESVDGKDNDEIKETLLKVARRSYWRNTLLFAVGHLVRHTKNRKAGTIMKEICEEINGTDNFPEENFTEDNYCKFGSYLAVALLEENLFSGRDQDGLVRTASELYNCDYSAFSGLGGAAAKRLVDYVVTKYGHKPEEYLALVKSILPMMANSRNSFEIIIEKFFDDAVDHKFEIARECMLWAKYLKERNGELLNNCFIYYTEEIEKEAAPDGPFTRWRYLNYICSKRRSEVSESVRAYVERELCYAVRAFRKDFDYDNKDPLFSRDYLKVLRKTFASGGTNDAYRFNYHNLIRIYFSDLPKISEEDVRVSQNGSTSVVPLLVQLLWDRKKETFEQFQRILANEKGSIKRLVEDEYHRYGIAEGDFAKFEAMAYGFSDGYSVGFKIETAAILDREGLFRLGSFVEGSTCKEGIFDELELILHGGKLSEEVLMTGIYLLIAIFDGSDERYRSLAHSFLDALQDKGVYYLRTLSLLWLLYYGGDREYVSEYRFGNYVSNNYTDNIFLDIHSKDTIRRTVYLLEEAAFGSLPMEFLLLTDEVDSHIATSLPVERMVLNRLQDKCAGNLKCMKCLMKLVYLSGSIRIKDILPSYEKDSDYDQWSLYRLVNSNYFRTKPVIEKRQDLMSLIRWLESSKDEFLLNDCIMELKKTF